LSPLLSSLQMVCILCDHTAQIWNATTRECEAELKGHSHWVTPTVPLQVLIAAEGALKHISDLEKKTKIKAAFLNQNILESQYAVLAGFNEALIQSEFGYMEEIHVFCCVEIPDSLLPILLPELGKVFTPYPGIIFMPLSEYETPVFKDDGTIWDYHDLSLHRAERHSSHLAKRILHPEMLDIFQTSLAKGQPSVPTTTGFASGCPEASGSNNHGGTGEDEGHGHHDSDDHHDNRERDSDPNGRNPGDEPDPGDSGKGDSSIPGFSFEVQVKLFIGTSNSEPLQRLEIMGELTAQVSVL